MPEMELGKKEIDILAGNNNLLIIKKLAKIASFFIRNFPYNKNTYYICVIKDN